MKKSRVKKPFLEQLAKTPVVSVACEKVGLSRQTVYRWREEDPEFAEAMDKAMSFGDDLINDMAESHFLSMIKGAYWPAIKLQLQTRHSKYMTNKPDKKKSWAEREKGREEKIKWKKEEEEKLKLQKRREFEEILENTKITLKPRTLKLLKEKTEAENNDLSPL